MSIPFHSARKGFTLIELLVVIAIIAVLIGLLVPAVQKVREAANRMTCSNNLKQMGLAFLNYESTNGMLPPAQGVKNSGPPNYPVWTGKNILNWSYAILPYLEEDNLAKSFTFSDNVVTPPVAAYGDQTSFVAQSPKVFRCPSDSFSAKGPMGLSSQPQYLFGLGTYGVSSGTDSAWVTGTLPEKNDGVIHFNSRTRMGDILDGSSNTILAGERSFDDPGLTAIGISQDTLLYHSAIWRNGYLPSLSFLRVPLDQINFRIPAGTPTTGAARNLAFNKRLMGYSSNHPGGANLVYGDGSVRYTKDALPLITLQALVTRAGGEVASQD